MNPLFKLAAAVVAGSLLAGCGGDNFTGAYRFKSPNSERTMVLNVHGDEAEIFGQEGAEGRIKPLVKMKVSVKGEKLLLDDVNGTERLALKRNVDERSLDCLNCKVLGIKDETLWKFDPKGPYDVEQMLKDQARKDEEALNAKMQKMQEQILEDAKRGQAAAKLGPYEGEWVYQRVSKQDPLSIMTILRKSQIKQWSFNFESMDRLSQMNPGFEVTDTGLKIGTEPKAHLYTLSADKKSLSCVDCPQPQRWAKADPNKDLSDRHYARQMAGRP
ncbi:hypothetical protein [Pseudomonas sp. MF4836]|uniref:hypothetical protein n=1 Tax=Pseudomonas sp. MF4836 TaxID=1960827 RepID=UPI0009C763C9|nr:hypothetical protein [Pseudomonas sp. MF4836]OOV91454.1 hypothetical protein MF4836_27900 [Pseudomonas sp. MF4836]